VPGSNLESGKADLPVGSLSFPQYFQENPGIVSRLGLYGFFPGPFEFVISSVITSTLYGLETEIMAREGDSVNHEI
jgi:hypothetical protein